MNAPTYKETVEFINENVKLVTIKSIVERVGVSRKVYESALKRNDFDELTEKEKNSYCGCSGHDQ